MDNKIMSQEEFIKELDLYYTDEVSSAKLEDTYAVALARIAKLEAAFMELLNESEWAIDKAMFYKMRAILTSMPSVDERSK